MPSELRPVSPVTPQAPQLRNRFGAPLDADLRLRQELAQHRARSSIERHVELHRHPILRAIATLPREREPAGVGPDRVDLDLGEGLIVWGASHRPQRYPAPDPRQEAGESTTF